MQYLSRSISANRPTRKKDRKVIYKFNRSLRSSVDDATRLAARTAKVTAAKAAYDEAAAKAKAAHTALVLSNQRVENAKTEGLSVEDLGPLLADNANLVRDLRGAEDVSFQKLTAMNLVVIEVEAKNRRETKARMARRRACAVAAMRGFYDRSDVKGTVTGHISAEKSL